MIERMEKGEYVPQLKEKRERVEALFSGYRPPALEVFESKTRHYRMRWVV
jgi:tRNA/tmRNA/rRNA uracil-C5-methylase (TrmA/RlmC/RlmD family)